LSVSAVDERKISELLRELNAWQTGHFLLSSGLHSNQYLQCQKILQYPRHGMFLAEELVRRVGEAGLRPTSVVGPALGAVHWELLVAMALDRANGSGAVRGLFAERPDGKTEFEIRRGIEIEPGEKILVVEDVTTTGGSARKVVELIKRLGGEPVGVGAIVDRSGGTVDFGIPFISLIKLSIETYADADCPWCKEGLPLVKPGSSKK
jgi:orotate phosphoribosyltransferase